MKAVRCSIAEARDGVARLHRHLPRVLGGIAACVILHHDSVVGYAIIGRPSSRVLQARGWLECTRVAVNGTRNAASCALGWAAREARARGAAAVVTYTLASEPGTSLIAAGWARAGLTAARRSWASVGRARADRVGAVAGRKQRWVARWCAGEIPPHWAAAEREVTHD